MLRPPEGVPHGPMCEPFGLGQEGPLDGLEAAPVHAPDGAGVRPDGGPVVKELCGYVDCGELALPIRAPRQAEGDSRRKARV